MPVSITRTSAILINADGCSSCAAVTEAAPGREAAPIWQQQASCARSLAHVPAARPPGASMRALCSSPKCCCNPSICSIPICGFPIRSVPTCSWAQLPARSAVHASWQAPCAQPSRQPGSFSHVSAGGREHARQHTDEAGSESQQHVTDSVHAVPASLVGAGCACTEVLTSAHEGSRMLSDSLLQPDQRMNGIHRKVSDHCHDSGSRKCPCSPHMTTG